MRRNVAFFLLKLFFSCLLSFVARDTLSKAFLKLRRLENFIKNRVAFIKLTDSEGS
jgi:hypothetical protein